MANQSTKRHFGKPDLALAAPAGRKDREPGEDDDDPTPAVDLVKLREAERELAERMKREERKEEP